MRFQKRRLYGLLFLMGLVAVCVVPMSVLHAQGGIVLQVALPEFARDFLAEDAFTQFETDNGVKVKVVYTGFDALFVTPAASDEIAHLDSIEEYVSKADVVTVGASNLTIDGTRAGYFLDLTPLTSADTSLNVDDFIPGTWQSFQWDGRIWGLPVLTSVISISYNPAAFDEAGLAYPSESWTIDDFANAARGLAQYDSSGGVDMPGFVTFGNTAYFLRALTGQGFYDSSTIPETPSFDNATLEALLTTWAEFEQEGIFAQSYNGNILDVPLRVFSTQGFGGFSPDQEQQESASVLLPGGVGGLDTQGFAVSSGTQYPELGYALAKYLTYNVQLATSPFGNSPARTSLIGQTFDQENNNGGGVIFVGGGANSPEIQAVIDAGLSSGLPASEIRYGDYVISALNNVLENGVDARSALQEAEAAAAANLQTAADRQTTTTVFVATPVPDIVLQPGEVALNFGMVSFTRPLPNQEEWNQLIAEYIAGDPQVGAINMDIGFGPNGSDFADSYDCYYLPYNAVPSLDTSAILSLDPFLDVDPSFNRDDMVGTSMSLVQKENKTWALPIIILPSVLRYHAEMFSQAGVPAPASGWTIDQFVDALRQLKSASEDPDQPPFVSRGAGGNYLLQLIAAYGGLPIDRRTDPPTINFTDPVTIDAIRQVLDLAKDGYISYEQLSGTAFAIAISDGEQQDAIYTDSLNGFGFREIVSVGDTGENPYRITTYPQGQYSTISYDMGTAYISATTQNAEACYRWISTLAQHPELFSGMPARRSVINSAEFVTTQGADTAAIYNKFDALMSDPNTLNFQSPFAGGADPGDFLLELWLNRAFDSYVLEDADLDTELTESQTYATAYLECVANIPPFDAAVQDRPAYMQQFFGCASSADPEIGMMFGPG
jgi:ABC-type glycerol-3-phosphate transport system substrate-binding protein